MSKNSRYKFYKNRYGEEIAELYLKNGFISWDLYTKQKISGSLMVEVNCVSCGNKGYKTSKALRKRKYQVQVCNKCILKYVTNMEEWRSNNSQAQLKIQSTVEQKMKNSMAVSKFWINNPHIKERVRKKTLDRYENENFKNSWMKTLSKKQHALSGIYKYDTGEQIYFGSSYELCFINFCEIYKNDWKISNVDFSIPYQYLEKTKHYIPDFILQLDNKKIIIEIKSIDNIFFDNEKQLKKTEATKLYVKENNYDDYWLISETHELAKEINFRRTSKIKPLCKELNVKNKIILFCEKKHKQYIGE